MNFFSSLCILLEYFFSFFISWRECILDRIGNIFSGVSFKQMMVSENGYTYFVWNFSRVMFSLVKKSLMNLSFSLYRSAESAIVPIRDMNFFSLVSSYAVRLEGMYPWSSVNK